jgi:hypothetical protein
VLQVMANEVAHRRVFERVDAVRHIHGLLLPMIVIDTRGSVEYKRSSLALLATFAGCPCNQAPRSAKGVQQCSIEK